MNDKLKQTVKILRSSEVAADGSGRFAEVDAVETAELELLSTQELRNILGSGDAEANDELREVAEGEDGILARDVKSGKFEIVSDEEMRQMLSSVDEETNADDAADMDEEEAVSDKDANELELVSTQMLRVELGPDGEKQIVTKDPDDSGFDPYDTG